MNRYAVWRYLLIAFLTLFSIVYALPNWFGSDPAIQVSMQSDAPSLDLKQVIHLTLSRHHIVYTSLKQSTVQNVLVRFKNTEDQLRAQSIIQSRLGSGYIVALNLASRTPGWLRVLGAEPMRLGLDLRGGIHFLLKVDLAAMQKERVSADVHEVGQLLREKRIRYMDARFFNGDILVAFRELKSLREALPLLQKHLLNYQATSNEKGQHFSILLSLLPKEKAALAQYAVEQNLNTLRNRVNALGIGEPVIQQQGRDQISVDLPGIQDTARAKNIIGKVATIRVQLQDTDHDAIAADRSGVVPFGSTLYHYEGHPVLLKNPVVLKGASITNASTSIDENGRPAVNIHLGGSEITYFNRITAENIGKPLAVVYVETKVLKQMQAGKREEKVFQTEKVINIATIRSALGADFQITGLPSLTSAKNLALLLRSGAYVAPVTFIQERVVGPSLGQQNISMGILSCEVGSLLIVLFMGFYYRLFGWVANFALVMNVVFLIAIMSILGATLTLPGIAGIVLTVGMAVDANVLINERIREELRNGMTPQAAIHSGYRRAFSTIVDANLTTLIVAIVLYALGTGSVQGFAVTLTIGLLTSMVTAIFFTRGIINLIYGGRLVRYLSIGLSRKSLV